MDDELQERKRKFEEELKALDRRAVANITEPAQFLQAAAFRTHEQVARPVLVRIYADLMSCNYDGNPLLTKAQDQIGLVLKGIL